MGAASDINTLMDESADAVAVENWALAENKAMQAWAKLISLPNAARSAANLSWDRTSMSEYLDWIRKNRSDDNFTGADGVQRPYREDFIYGPEVQ